MAEAIRTDVAEPLPLPEPPRRKVPPGRWIRENLFSTWYNSLLTVVFTPLLVWVVFLVARWALVDARWDIVRVNLRLFLVFRFPPDQIWRLWTVMVVLAAAFGFAAGVAVSVRKVEVAAGRQQPVDPRLGWRRIAPVAVLTAVLIWLGGSIVAVGLVALAVVAWLAARRAGQLVPRQRARWGPVVAVAGLVAAYVILTGFGGVGWGEAWGGLLLTAALAAGGIVLSFPLGVLLALGRRSSLPAVRVVCVGYIELIRGVPLITLLFMSFFLIGFFLPAGTAAPSTQTRGLVAIILFTAAYVAEIVRGGLQAVPKGQVEAAQALGLSTVATTRLIVLPQALRVVIPALVGQFISLFKDTSLVFIIGLTDLLAVASIVTQQPDFQAQGLIFETLVFVSLVYWVGSYSMSRESQRLEQRLGVGER
jgi:general L-amino acid transport system permease protein